MILSLNRTRHPDFTYQFVDAPLLIGSVFDQFKMPTATGDKRARLGRKSPPPGSEPGDKDWSEEANP
jgi:hypothetical protein